jgi:hypothetical protein
MDGMTGTRRIVLGVVMPVVVAVALTGTARAGWPQAPAPVRAREGAGRDMARDTGVLGHASHDGSYWQALSGKGKDAYVREFLGGVLSEQVREIAVPRQRSAGSADGRREVRTEVPTEVPTEVRDKIVDSLRASHAVRFPFAATVYVAQLDDFYWWQDHKAVTVDDALHRINAQMEAQQSRP